MTRVGWLDLASGASGDMLMSCAASAGRALGVPVDEAMAKAVESLGLGCSVSFAQVDRRGIAGLHATVEGGDRPVDPDGLRRAIDSAAVSDAVRTKAVSALEALVQAEARVHGTDPQGVHLHELGTADTAVDLVGTAAGLEALGVARLYSAPVPLSAGWTRTQHGPTPLPAPATLELLQGAVVRSVDDPHELVTPTAAAVLSAHGAVYGSVPPMTLEATGIGAGTKDFERPNVCRLLVGTAADVAPELSLETNVLLEANIDDQSPEAIGYATSALMQAGALDAWVTPIVMKKSRPAFLLSVLCEAADEPAVLTALFRETTTLGARRRPAEKWVLARETVVVDGIRVKIARLHGDVVTTSPEFEDCAARARETGEALTSIYERVRRAVNPEGS